MRPYAEDLRRWRLVQILRAVLDAGGNQSTAAGALGVHRNTVSRAVRSAGYSTAQLKRVARAEAFAKMKKPPARETAPLEARRSA